ncbi:ABC transporter permease [Planotetraspora sp. GP83]|uniref:ABC transporter permease n=1 Tax=Planotetraspora sp. GP83 TaxID=3156264 RepID=UPI0035186DFB
MSGRLKFLLSRLGLYLLTAWVAVTVNFLVPRFMPGDPAQEMADRLRRQTGQAPSAEQLAAIRRFFGDPTKNLFQQYLDYFGSVTRLEFGTSLHHYPVPVATLVGEALPWTIALVGTTTLVAWLLGTALGTLLGWKPGGRLDTLIAPTTTFLHAIPAFWLALIGFYVFAFKLEWFPLGGAYDADLDPAFSAEFLGSALWYGALPALALIFVGFNGWLFGMRNMMISTIGEDYVLLARAKGLSALRIMFQYAARNAMLPNITGLAVAVGAVIGGELVTEVVFSYPGLGYVLFEAVKGKDYPVMQMIFLVITLIAVTANFLADFAYTALDPRTKERV